MTHMRHSKSKSCTAAAMQLEKWRITCDEPYLHAIHTLRCWDAAGKMTRHMWRNLPCWGNERRGSRAASYIDRWALQPASPPSSCSSPPRPSWWAETSRVQTNTNVNSSPGQNTAHSLTGILFNRSQPMLACSFFLLFFCCPIILAELIDALLLCHSSRQPYLQPHLRLSLHHGPAPYPRGLQKVTAQSFGVLFALPAIVAKDGKVKS